MLAFFVTGFVLARLLVSFREAATTKSIFMILCFWVSAVVEVRHYLAMADVRPL